MLEALLVQQLAEDDVVAHSRVQDARVLGSVRNIAADAGQQVLELLVRVLHRGVRARTTAVQLCTVHNDTDSGSGGQSQFYYM